MRRLVAVLLLCLGLTGCQPADKTAQFFALDTYNTLQIQGSQVVLDDLVASVYDYESLFSRQLADAELAHLNEKTELDPADLSSELVDLLTQSLTLATLTDGAFDPTVGVLVDAWGIGTDHQGVPTTEELETAMAQIGYQNLTITEQSISLQNQIQLDLGGIAKGYITDKLVEDLTAQGVQTATISLGGNTYVLGDKDGNPYRVGITDPFDPTGLIGVLTVSDCAIVTSGVYQRYFEEDGKTYHHLLDPESGYPVDNGLSAVTVVSKSATLADAYATALMVLGEEDGMALVEADPALEAVFVRTDRTVVCSSGVAENFTLQE